MSGPRHQQYFYGDCLITTKMLHNFIREKAMGDSELAPVWKATYNEIQGFSDCKCLAHYSKEPVPPRNIQSTKSLPRPL